MTLQKFFIAFEFAQSKVDPTLYVWTRGGSFAMIVVYVDNILMSGDCEDFLDLVVIYFKWSCEVRVDTKIKKFPGISIQDNGYIVKFFYAPMIRRLLKEFGMQDCKPTNTFLLHSLDLAVEYSQTLINTTPYQQLIGSLHYLANTVRSDFALLLAISHGSCPSKWRYFGRQVSMF